MTGRARAVCKWVILLPTITTLGKAAGLAAQPEQPGACQATANVTLVAPALATRYLSTYVPPFPDASSTGEGGQSIEVTADSAAGFEGAVTCFPVPRFGIQVLGSYTGNGLSGAGNGPHTVHLEWIARQPPDYVPRSYSTDASTSWPATQGSMRQVTLSFNAVARTSPRRRVRAALSGGLSYFNVRGTLQPLGLTSFWFGGHSVLFSEEYKLRMRVEPASGLGLNVGGTLEYWMSGRAAVSLDYRLYRAASLSSTLTVAEVINPDAIYMDRMSLADLQRALGPRPLDVDPSFSRLAVGFAFRF